MARHSVKEEIVEAAGRLLHQRGYNACGVQDITAEAGVPKGSFYNHFESKETLAVEVLERYWQGTLSSLEQLRDDDAPPIARLKAYFRSLSAYHRELEYRPGCMIGNFGSELSDQSPLMRGYLAKIMSAWSRAIQACVKDAQAEGAVRKDLDPATIASFLLNSWEGAVLRAKIDRSKAPFDTFEKVVFAWLVPANRSD